MRPTQYEIKDSTTTVIPVDVRFDPETGIGEPNCYLIEQDTDAITVTLEMAKHIVLAIEKLDQSRPAKHEPEWKDNWKDEQ